MAKDLKGQKFGRWTVLEKIEGDTYKHPMWLCKCECGSVKEVAAQNLVKGLSKSCGCLRGRRYMDGKYMSMGNRFSEEWNKATNRLKSCGYDLSKIRLAICETNE